MKAKLNGAKLIHVDPRFTRTSAVADLHVPIRAGSDIAFLGGLINYVIHSPRWNTDPFFKEFVVNYTNAATIINDDFKDTEDLEGVFLGPQGVQGARLLARERQPRRVRQRELGVQAWAEGAGPGHERPDRQARRPAIRTTLVRSLSRGPPSATATLQNPRCAFQILKRHFSRYNAGNGGASLRLAERKVHQVAEALLENSGRDRTSAFAYAVAWTQHTYGVR